MKKSKSMIVLFLAPAVLFFCAIFIYPIIRTLAMSLFKVENMTGAIADWEFVGFSNYTTLLNTQIFGSALMNLLKIWAIGGLIVMTLGMLFAVILNSGIRFKKAFRAIIYMPNIVSAVALATMWIQYVYNPRFGLVKSFFETIGATELAKINWTSPNYKFTAMLIAYCFGMVGYHMLIFSSGIEKIPADYFEASTIDGAGQIRQFMHITWPLCRGVLRTNITMWSITSVGFFVWSQLFSTVTADKSTITPLVYLYMQTFGSGNVVTDRNAGLGAAIGVILAVIVVLVFFITNRVLKEDNLEM